jgi:uncharacterized protein (UPF0276 family)
MVALPQVPRLGVGLTYGPSFRPFIEQHTDCLDFIEVVPDTLWTDLGRGRRPRYVNASPAIDFLRQARTELPVVPHSIGLSIGSAHRFDRAHVAQMARWHELFAFPWHSDHLSYNLAEHAAGEINVGLTLPLPFDHATVEFLTPRIKEVRARVPTPFLLENNVYFFNLPQQDYDEAGFWNALCAASGGRQLLDLHNLYTNCRNHGTDPYVLLDQLDLANVIELHVAGGMMHAGFYLDSHSNVSPPAVWKLLEWVLPRCPNLGGVVFELTDSWFERVGPKRLTAQLTRMKEMWLRHQPMPQRQQEVA